MRVAAVPASVREFARTASERLARLADHEREACYRHWLAAREHWRVAQRARDATELLRNQVDLLPATQQRLANDHRQRIALLRLLVSAPGKGTEA